MRFETEHRGFRDMVAVRADCIDAALAGWHRLGTDASRRAAVAEINKFFGLVQQAFPCHATVAPMRGNQLALTREEPEIVAEVPVPVDVQTFGSPFGKTRVVMFPDGTPWFVEKDVIVGLGLQAHEYSPSNHIARLAQDQRQTVKRCHISNVRLRDELMPLDGKAYSMSLISRGGFNDLVLESRKPVAREYRQWVTDEVLPALQHTGTFTDTNHPAQKLGGNNPTHVIMDDVVTDTPETTQQGIDAQAIRRYGEGHRRPADRAASRQLRCPHQGEAHGTGRGNGGRAEAR